MNKVINYPEDLEKLAEALDFIEEDKRIATIKALLGILILN